MASLNSIVNTGTAGVAVTGSLAALPLVGTSATITLNSLVRRMYLTIINPVGSAGTINTFALKRVDDNGNVQNWLANTDFTGASLPINIFGVSGGSSGSAPNNIAANNYAWIDFEAGACTGLQVWAGASSPISSGVIISLTASTWRA